MPLYQGAATLGDAVASVQAQTSTDWELIVADDGSTDGGPALAETLAAADPRVRLVRLERNCGAAAARNAALALARGRYVAFLDADDRWLPGKLERQLAFMAETGAALTFTAYLRTDETGRVLARAGARDRVDYAGMLGANPIGCLTAVYDRARLGPQPMPEDLPRQHDYALWLRLVRLGGPARGLDEALAVYRVGRGTLSANKVAAARDIWRVWRHHEGLGRAAAMAAFGRYAAHSLRHRLFERVGSRRAPR